MAPRHTSRGVLLKLERIARANMAGSLENSMDTKGTTATFLFGSSMTSGGTELFHGELGPLRLHTLHLQWNCNFNRSIFRVQRRPLASSHACFRKLKALEGCIM